MYPSLTDSSIAGIIVAILNEKKGVEESVIDLLLVRSLPGSAGAMETIRELAQFLATLSCGLFAGAAIYVSLVEHPARLECGTEIAATEFGPSYRRAAIMQASLAAIGFLCSIAAWLAGASLGWLVGGVLLGSVIPFTLVVMMPTNKQLLAPDLEKGSAQTSALLSRWGKLHAVRTALSGIASVIFLLSI